VENQLLDWLLNVIDKLPAVESISIPSEVYLGIDKMTALLGYYMPADLYKPLFAFILSLTAFRIAYAVFMRIKK